MDSGRRIPAFDLIGERYEQSFADRSEQEYALSWLLDRLPPGGRVIDLGCGTGTPAAVRLAEAGADVVGIDESERVLRVARERVPSATFRCGDMRELDGALGSFDAATAFFSLLMLSKQDVRTLLRDLRSKMRGPGLLALSMVEGDYDLLPLTFLGVDVPTTAFPPAVLVDEVEQAGFRVEQTRFHHATVEPARVERQIYLLAAAS